MENRYQFYCTCKHFRSPILCPRVKLRPEVSTEFEPSHLNLGLGNFMLIRVHVESWARKDQCGVYRLILHGSHRETKAKPWTLPQVLIPWGPEQEAESHCPNVGAESLENLLSLHAVPPRRHGSGAW